MYNHYIDDSDWILLDDEKEREPPRQERPTGNSSSTGSGMLGELSGSLSQLLGGLTKHFSLEKLDTGDILLVLILLFLFLEGDNLEVVITLGLMLLLGLGEEGKRSSDH